MKNTKTLKKQLMSWITLLALISTTSIFADDFIMPIDRVGKPWCKTLSWSETSSNCKMDLPILKLNTLWKDVNNVNKRITYSVLRWSTYEYGWDIKDWSHTWVDIATNKWTPVMSMWEWIILSAKNKTWWGNVITVKHTLDSGEVIYSNYAHLSKILKYFWKVKKWEIIWEVWSTWYSTWNHLHFQIDTSKSPFHPFYYSINCSNINSSNKTKCRNELETNTYDPIDFINNSSNSSNSSNSKKLNNNSKNYKTEKIQIIKKEEKINNKKVETVLEPIKINKVEKKKVVIINNKKKELMSREEIDNIAIKQFNKRYKITTTIQYDWNIKVWDSLILKVKVSDKYWRPYTWEIPWTWVQIIMKKGISKISPSVIRYVENWARTVKIKALTPWEYSYQVLANNDIITAKKLYFYTDNDLLEVNTAKIVTKTSGLINSNVYQWLVIFQNESWNNLINIPYSSSFKLRVKSRNAKLYLGEKYKSDDYYKLSYEYNFDFYDTKKGVLVFNFIPLNTSKIEFEIIDNNSWKILWILSAQSNNPKDLRNDHIYVNNMKSGLKKWLPEIASNKILPDSNLMVKDAEVLCKKVAWYEYMRSWDNFRRKQEWINKKNSCYSNQLSVKNITRHDFAKLVIWLYWDKNTQVKRSNTKNFLDEWRYNDSVIANLRTNYNFKWKDKFWDKYFQWDKQITRAEAYYLVDILLNKEWNLLAKARNNTYVSMK